MRTDRNKFVEKVDMELKVAYEEPWNSVRFPY